LKISRAKVARGPAAMHVLQRSLAFLDDKLDVNKVLQYHAFLSILIGGLAFCLPHGLLSKLSGSDVEHHLHEVVRMYGALTLAQVGNHYHFMYDARASAKFACN
jgi:hypothetical protein